MPKTVADYEDAVRRITAAEVSPDSTTAGDVLADLRGANAPQVTRAIAREIADSIVTEDRIIEAIESSGELPSEGVITATTTAFDDYDLEDRQDAVQRAVRERVATVEDVEEAVRERREQGGPVFREQVETAVGEVAGSREFVGESADEVATEQAREIGAPRESEYRQAAVDTLTEETVTPADSPDIPGESSTPIPIVRNQQGEVVGVQVAGSQKAAEAVAESRDAEVVGGVDEFGLEQGGGEAHLTLDGERIREVSVE